MPPISRSAKAGELSAAANLEQMNAKFDQAEAEWKRAQELYNTKLMAQVDYDTDKANYEVAKANVSVAKAGHRSRRRPVSTRHSEIWTSASSSRRSKVSSLTAA